MQSFVLELWRGLLTSMAFADDQDFSENKNTHSRLPTSSKVRFILQDSSASRKKLREEAAIASYSLA